VKRIMRQIRNSESLVCKAESCRMDAENKNIIIKTEKYTK
jgi:hypothetical protein